MSLRLCSLSSGSRGNCIIIASDSVAIVLDCGIPATSIISALKLLKLSNPKVMITHCHHDHISTLGSITKKLQPDVYCHTDCYFSIKSRLCGGRLIAFESDFFIGDITVSPFRVNHDVPCFGYSFYNNGRKLSIVTDLGCVTQDTLDALRGSDLIFIEANHDEQLLQNNTNYSQRLKKRILSGRGHLSNTACGNALKAVVDSGVKQIVLGHLSEENNYPELAYNTVSAILGNNNLRIEVATYNKLSAIFEIV